MSAALGELLVRLNANIAEFEKGIGRAEHLFNQHQRNMEAGAGKINGLLAGIGVGVSFAGIIAFAKHTLDTAENLSKLSQKTGITVEELSKLRYVAQQNDVPIEALAKGMNKLSKFMTEAGDSTSKSGQIMKLLGVDLTKGLDPALGNIADAFARLPDGPQKAALAMQLFGKAGTELIPMLNGGSAGIRALKEEADKLGLTLSTEAAKRAEAFNDVMKKVKSSSEATGMAMLTSMGPSLERITKAMHEAVLEGGVLKAVIVGIGGVMSEGLGMNDEQAVKDAQALKKMKAELLIYEKQINDAKAEGLNWEYALTKENEKRMQLLQHQIKVMELVKQAQAGMFADASDRRQQQGRVNVGGIDSKLEKELAAALAQGEKMQQFQSMLAGARAALAAATAEAANGILNLTASEKKLITIQSDPSFMAFSKLQQDQIKNWLGQAAAQEKVNVQFKKGVDAQKAMSLAFAESKQELDDYVAARGILVGQIIYNLQSELELLQLETTLLGRSNNERELEMLLYRKKIELEKSLDPIQRANIARKYDEIEASLKLRQARQLEMEQQMAFWQGAADRAANFVDHVMDGGNAMDFLKAQAKDLAKELIKTFTRKYVLQMGVAATGNTALTGGDTGGWMDAIMGMFGGGGKPRQGPTESGGNVSDSFFNSGGTSFMGGNASAGGMMGGAAMGAGISSLMEQFLGNDRNKQSMELGGTIGGAIGSIWGPIGAAIGSAIGSALGSLISSGGGDKIGGSFLGAFDPSGRFLGESRANTDNGRLFTPDQGDSELRRLVMTTGQAYATLTRAMGGTGAGFGFGLGFDTDPKGTAPDRTRTRVTDAAGNVILDRSRDLGKDSDMTAELATEAQRAILAALTATDFDDHIDALLRTVNIDTASLAELNDVLKQAEEMGRAISGLAELGVPGLDLDALLRMQEVGENLSDVFSEVADNQAKFYDQFYTQGENVARLQGLMAGKFEELGAAMPATDEGFRSLMEGLDLTDESQARLYRSLLELAGGFDALTDATEASLAQFDEYMAANRAGYEASRRQMQIDADIARFRGMNPGASGDTTALIEAFRNMSREEFAAYDLVSQELILALLKLTSATDKNTQAAAKPVANPNYGGSADINAMVGGIVGGFESQFGGVIGGQSTHSEQFALRSVLLGDKIKQLQDQLVGITDYYRTDYHALPIAIAELQAQRVKLAADLGRLAILGAQYGTSIGDQLFDLEDWYTAQKALVGNNQAALLALEKQYQDKRADIITGGLDALSGSKSKLADFIEGLLRNQQLSPLSLQSQMVLAEQQYKKTLALAQGGDINAINALGGTSQNYLQLARQIFKSSGAYNEIYRQTIGELAGVAGVPDIDAKLAAALPQNGQLSTGTDVMKVTTAVYDLLDFLMSGKVIVKDPVTQAKLDDLNSSLRTGTGVFA